MDIRFLSNKFLNRWLWFLLRKLWKSEPESNPVDDFIELNRITQKIFLLKQVADQREKDIEKGTNLDEALHDWTVRNFRNSRVFLVDALNQVPSFVANSIEKNVLIIVAPSWMKRELRDRGWIHFFLLFLQLRKLMVPILMVPSDPCDLNYVIKCYIIVSKRKGMILSSPHSSMELHRFGVPHAIGPIFWTLPQAIEDSGFFNDKFVSVRKRVAVLAGSGGGASRVELMEKLSCHLESVGYEIVITRGQFKWNEYVDLVKNAALVATSSWLQEEHSRRMWMHKSTLPSTVLTHRLLEGFVAGALVITNRCEALTFLGFKAGTHYLEVASDNLFEDTSILSNQEKLNEIAMNGQELMRKVLIEQNPRNS